MIEERKLVTQSVPENVVRPPFVKVLDNQQESEYNPEHCSVFYFCLEFWTDNMDAESLAPRERRYRRTKQAILDAARQTISQKGVDALSMRGIARAIDYSPAGLYEYFGSKEEIIRAVCGQGFHRFGQYLRRVDLSLPAEEYVRELGIAYIDFAIKNPDFFLLMFTTVPLAAELDDSAAPPEVPSSLNEDDTFSILLRGIERCVAEGIFEARPGYGALQMAYGAWAIVHGIAMLRITALRDYPQDFEQADRETLRALFHGMKT